jgi:hypothetical protein
MIESGLALIASCLPTMRIRNARGAFHEQSINPRQDGSGLTEYSDPATLVPTWSSSLKAVAGNELHEMLPVIMPDKRKPSDSWLAV